MVFLFASRKPATNATTTATTVLPLPGATPNVDNASTPWSHLVFVGQFLSTPDNVTTTAASSTPSGNPNALSTGMTL